MYDNLSPHAAHDRVVALLREQHEFRTANGNAFTARMVGADIELAVGGKQRRINFGEFSMFIRSAQRMTLPDMVEFARFTNAASALLALMDSVVAQGAPRPTVSVREPSAPGAWTAPSTSRQKRTPVGFRGFD